MTVRFRVIVEEVREGMRQAQMLMRPGEISRLFQEDGMATGVRNTFKPLTYTANGDFLCDNELYLCPEGEQGGAMAENAGQGSSGLLGVSEIAGITGGVVLLGAIATTYVCMANWDDISEAWGRGKQRMQDAGEDAADRAQVCERALKRALKRESLKESLEAREP